MIMQCPPVDVKGFEPEIYFLEAMDRLKKLHGEIISMQETMEEIHQPKR